MEKEREKERKERKGRKKEKNKRKKERKKERKERAKENTLFACVRISSSSHRLPKHPPTPFINPWTRPCLLYHILLNVNLFIVC